ncbi:MAG: nucleotide sugar dehydrogenase [Flavobacteriales bacterium]|nr:nucleotide sugar dehydrogenase [Flavobacteriales bacterium]
MKQKIAVVGVGKLGLCFALNLEKVGFEVWGIECKTNYSNQLKQKDFESDEPFVNEMLCAATSLVIEDDIACVQKENIKDIFLMVATPSLPDGGYDHSQIERVTDRLIALGKSDNVRNIYVGCTTMPGYCAQLSNKLGAYGYTVSYNPEFIAQGSIIRDQQFPDQVLIGEFSQEVGDRLESIYRSFVKSNAAFCRMDPLSAEITKLATNCFLTTKISFANSIGDLAKTAGADVDSILKAIGADSRIGSKYLNYGFGFGGPCFPRDNRALGKYANSVGYPLRISEATDMVNEEHFQFQFQHYLENTSSAELVVFDGVAYKAGTTQITESQQLRLAVALAKAGRKVVIKDSAGVIDQVSKLHPELFKFETAVEAAG